MRSRSARIRGWRSNRDVLWTLGELGTFPIAATTVANIAPKDVRGTYQGLYNLVWSLSNAFSPLVGGWILNAFGSRVLWICCTVMFSSWQSAST